MSDPLGSASYDVDVIIVGAGAIGLTAACALGHHSVKTRVFEERTEPKPHSRANNVWARGQELLHGIGVRDALRQGPGGIDQGDGAPFRLELPEVSALVREAAFLEQEVLLARLRQGDRVRQLAKVEEGRMGAAEEIHQIGGGIEQEI